MFVSSDVGAYEISSSAMTTQSAIPPEQAVGRGRRSSSAAARAGEAFGGEARDRSRPKSAG
mgnify:CR=1 FL=1